MKTEIIKYCTENKIAIEFESSLEFLALMDYFGFHCASGRAAVPDFGVVSFYHITAGHATCDYRWCSPGSNYWETNGYQIIPAADFFELCEEKSILTVLM